ncbi:P27 family phage terminase small subunit [Clostridium thermobutyricum]|uniref:Phage terminase, small subunit n=1 Tax=Clostridium thermobutyricum DSM 4928 TaxID=1121339 RepID=A0A1V4SUX9_9CLOT|nr:P27 family phage terminase small subunit [Clostridium thermobutyricum]OPX47831.1 phage terminase, small subunit [Clostridium thermobutyricum DSM 4928]
MKNYEEAYKDYRNNMSLKDIAEKYNVKLNTVNSWRKRYSWVEKLRQEPTLRDEIKNNLLRQLEENNISGKHFIDLIEDYMNFFDIKNELQEDIKQRGAMTYWTRGRESGWKKNESLDALNKVNTQMLKILSELRLKPVEIAASIGDDDDEI